MSKKAKYGVLLNDDWTVDEVFNKLKSCQLGNHDCYYGYYRGYKVSTDMVDRDDLYLKIYGKNRNESLKEQVVKQLEEQQFKLFKKQKNIYKFSDKLNQLSWQKQNFLLSRPDWMIEMAESPYDGEEFIIAINYVLLIQNDKSLSNKQRKQFLKLLDEQDKRKSVYSILQSFGYTLYYLNDLKD